MKKRKLRRIMMNKEEVKEALGTAVENISEAAEEASERGQAISGTNCT